LKKLQTKLDNSGLSRKFSPTEWMVLNNLISYSAAIAFSLLLWFTTEIALVQNIILSLFIVGLTKYIIHFIMLRKMKGRKGEMLRELPFTLDLVTVSVEAGLSFDGAILKVVQTRNNALSDEFEKLLKEIKIGMVRRVALKNMMKRVNLDELNTLLVAVIQADELGVSISKVLKVQAEFIRENRKMRAREKAMKAPVKMLFPLIFFIFPSIFVIILGPAVIKMMTMFM
jgi:tight adherence protein C